MLTDTIKFEWLNTMLGYIYQFFMNIVSMIQAPFNNPFATRSFYNPFFNTTVDLGIGWDSLPEWIQTVVEFLNHTVYDVFNLFLIPFGIDVSYPFWVVAICLVPTIFAFIFLFNLVYKILPVS